MPLTTHVDCPQCGVRLVRKPGGRCPECGADVRAHVVEQQERETRIEKIVAVVSTLLVVSVSIFAGGCTVVEGALAYVVAGIVIWYWGKRTFSTD